MSWPEAFVSVCGMVATVATVWVIMHYLERA